MNQLDLIGKQVGYSRASIGRILSGTILAILPDGRVIIKPDNTWILGYKSARRHDD